MKLRKKFMTTCFLTAVLTASGCAANESESYEQNQSQSVTTDTSESVSRVSASESASETVSENGSEQEETVSTTSEQINATTDEEGNYGEDAAEAAVKEMSETAVFKKQSTQQVRGESQTCYVYEDDIYTYTVVCGTNYLYKMEARSASADELKDVSESNVEDFMKSVLSIRGELEPVVLETGYLHYKETQDGIDTGTYAIFLTDLEGALTEAYFFQGSNYDVDVSKMIDKEEAFNAAVKEVRGKYEREKGEIDEDDPGFHMEINQKFENTPIEITAIKDTLYYVVTVYAHEEGYEVGEDEEEPYYFFADINVYTGECYEISSNIIAGTYTEEEDAK